MNTTAVSSFSGLLSTAQRHHDFIVAFRKLAHARMLTPQHLALRALVLGKPLGRAFSPVTNTVKLANGQEAWREALTAARTSVCWPDAGTRTLLDAAAFTPEESAALQARILAYRNGSLIAQEHQARHAKSEVLPHA